MVLKERAYAPDIGSRPASGAVWTEIARVSDYLTIVALTGILLCVALLIGRYTTFFTVDQDIKYLAASSLLHHWNDAAIPYPLQHLDPRGTYTLPLTAWVHGHQYAGYSLPFELVGAAAMSLFGPAGLVLPAVVGTAGLLIVQLQLASLLGLKGRREVLLVATVVATPVLFYSLVFWEHTWGVALLLGGFGVLLAGASRDESRRDDCLRRGAAATTAVAGDGTFAHAWWGAIAGGLFAGAVLMRRETAIPAAVALIIVPLLFRRRPVLTMIAIAAAAFLLPLGITYALHPEPLVLGLTHSSPGRAGISPGATSNRVRRLEWLTSGGFATAVFVLCSLALVFIKWVKSTWLPAAFALCSVVAGLAFVIQLFSHYTWADLNPLAFCPLAVWGVWAVLLPGSGRGRGVQIAIWGTCILGAVATVVMASDFGGAQWGPRYLLFAFPLLILLAVKAREEARSAATGRYEKRVVEFSFVGILALSVLLQGAGVMAIVKGKQELSSAQAAIARLHPNVVVSQDLSIDGLAPLAAHKTLLFAPSRGALATLMSLLRSRGHDAVIFVCASSTRCHWSRFPGWRRGTVNSEYRHILRYSVYHSTG